MAGRGPAPKPLGVRRNRTAPARGEWVDLEPLTKPVLDELPPLENQEWGPNTIRMWEAWRQDPVTALWSSADIAFALDTIMIHNLQAASDAPEIRLRMTALGLNPKGKRDLRYRLPNAGAEVTPIRASKRMPQTRKLRAV